MSTTEIREPDNPACVCSHAYQRHDYYTGDCWDCGFCVRFTRADGTFTAARGGGVKRRVVGRRTATTQQQEQT